ncbi:MULTISPECIES: TonB-dependent receptor [Sphingobium]|uniref:TonB-dependent receptor n=1 Tax=Sphingobium TaxID=165695 RepID=UPI0005CB9A77|nr:MULTISPECIES: TonB-dependent receptor [Sphingobium]AJR25015.1 TonB-dependent receptor [Sphingobium sp. YBL2]RYL97670.1 TonB-dependent receptor [Sphingobium fuliginis]WDA37222.1 TonB-dependent receptor [Sphingobium sp. YC-XJ3]
MSTISLSPRFRHALGASALALLAAAYVTGAHAEETPAVPAEVADADAGAGIVVTAQRREERLQDVPVAVTAFDKDLFSVGGLGRSANEVLNYVPNASAGTQQHGRPRWWIRGVGAGQQQLDLANPVGFYLDDVYISNSSATGLPLFDLERVEVLRGPQGTLWGKNTTGGAVNIISKRPSLNGQDDNYVKLEYGSFDNKIAEGGIGTTLVDDKLAARVSFRFDDRGGRFDNLYTGNKSNEIKDNVIRGQLLAKPTDNLQALLSVHYRDYDTNGTYWTTASYLPSGVVRNGYAPSTDINDISTNAPEYSRNKQFGGSLHVDWDLGNAALTWIAGYERFTTRGAGDTDYTPLEISRSYTQARSSQWTQELRLASSGEDRLSWIVGAFYFNEKIRSNAFSATLPQGAVPAQAITPTGPALAFSNTAYRHKAESGAVFGSTTFRFTDALKLTLGGRWTRETKTLDFDRRASPAATTPGAVFTWSNYAQWWNSYTGSIGGAGTFSNDLKRTWDAFTYDVTPSWNIDRDNLVYAKFSHGVKSGGFNTAATLPVALTAVRPEKLDAYEIGYKSSWFDGLLTFNATAFHYDYKDVQVNVVGPNPGAVGGATVSYLQNAAKAKVDGAEFELALAPVEGLKFNAALGLLDTKYTRFIVQNSTTSLAGARFVRSPKVTLNVGGSYRFPLAELGTLELAADARYQSRQYYYVTPQDTVNRYYLAQKPYTLTNIRATYTTPDEKLSVTGFVNNLFDVRYLNHSLPAANAAQGVTGDTVAWADPRTAGVAALFRF